MEAEPTLPSTETPPWHPGLSQEPFKHQSSSCGPHGACRHSQTDLTHGRSNRSPAMSHGLTKATQPVRDAEEEAKPMCFSKQVLSNVALFM